MDVSQTLGQRIKEYRRGAGKTQLDFARLAGISPSYISRLERGTATNPTNATLKRIACTLGVTREELLCDEEQTPACVDYLMFYTRYERLCEKRQRDVRLVLEAMMDKAEG